MVLNRKAYYNISDGGRRGKGSLGVGEECDYTYRYTVTTWMTPALRWAVMRAILTFH